MNRTAVIAGSTGLIGSELLRLLLDDGNYGRVVALVRRPQSVANPKYEEIVTAFDDLGRIPAIRADAAFCALGTTIKTAGSREAFARVDHAAVVDFAYWARSGEAASFAVVSSIGAGAGRGSFYLAVKGEMEEGVIEQRFPATHIFRPSVFLGKRSVSRAGERFAASLLQLAAPLMIGPLRDYRAIPAEAVARAMVAASASEARGRFVHTYAGIVDLAR
ncbi:MAG: NAD-dependent epimerase/dehydratase family protein [Bryobacteraceae bacterium]|nr:NAD-dependent epimerase/dehydratase family protein [Bryobacteraceae bacterium]